jgi:hypothetical protein
MAALFCSTLLTALCRRGASPGCCRAAGWIAESEGITRYGARLHGIARAQTALGGASVMLNGTAPQHPVYRPSASELNIFEYSTLTPDYENALTN